MDNPELKLLIVSGSFLRKAVAPILNVGQEATMNCSPNGVFLIFRQPTTLTSNTDMVLEIKSEKFIFFRCDEDVSVGVNLDKLAGLLSLASDEDFVTISCESEKVTIVLGLPHYVCRVRIFCESNLDGVNHRHLTLIQKRITCDVSFAMSGEKFREIIVYLINGTEVNVAITHNYARFSVMNEEIIIDKPGEFEMAASKPGRCPMYPLQLKFGLHYVASYLTALEMSKWVFLNYTVDSGTALIFPIETMGDYTFAFKEGQQNQAVQAGNSSFFRSITVRLTLT